MINSPPLAGPHEGAKRISVEVTCNSALETQKSLPLFAILTRCDPGFRSVDVITNNIEDEIHFASKSLLPTLHLIVSRGRKKEPVMVSIKLVCALTWFGTM